MNTSFYQQLFNKQLQRELVPANDVIATWATHLICLLYPELSLCSYDSVLEVEEESLNLKKDLINLLHATKACSNFDHEEVAINFFNNIPELYRILNTDAEALLNGDPAARSKFEVIRAYPGFYALCFYRIAHALYKLDVPLLPRILTEFAHSKTGIDIHPAAEIGEHFFIDHGTGTVIGETTHIGNHVKLYQGVTLGAMSIDKSMAFTKRHPTVEDHVLIYSGATILGGDTVIGHHSIIGGNVWLTRSVPPWSLVYHNPEITIAERKMENN